MTPLLVLLFLYLVSGLVPQELHETEFRLFMQKYQKVYSPQDYQRKLHIFSQNMESINQHNRDPTKTYTLKMNQFGDLTKEEFSVAYLGFVPTKAPNRVKSQTPDLQLPVSWDWSTKGAVTPAKLQGECGSCYAFSSVGAVESCHFIDTGVLVGLSEQNIADCSSQQGNDGCSGGLNDYAFEYIIANHGIDSESCYPYIAQDNNCVYKQSCCASTITNFTDVAAGDEKALQQAVYKTPVAVTVDASTWQFYYTGVFTCTTSEVDHTALATGWGVDSGAEFWNVKNSWGPDWGLNGYIWIAKNKGDSCGIASMASYPTGCYNFKS